MAASDDLLNQWKKEQELTAAPAAGTTTNSTGSDALLNSWKNDLESNITVSVQNAAKGNPERAAEVQKVARALLVPTDVVDKNWDNLSAFAKTRQFQMQRNAAEALGNAVTASEVELALEQTLSSDLDIQGARLVACRQQADGGLAVKAPTLAAVLEEQPGGRKASGLVAQVLLVEAQR